MGACESMRVSPGFKIWRRGLAGACAFGIMSRSCPAALLSGLWPFLSPPQEGKVAFCGAHPFSLSVQGFVLAVTIIREAVEEIRCYLRDKEVNSQVYSRLTARGQPSGSAGAPPAVRLQGPQGCNSILAG